MRGWQYLSIAWLAVAATTVAQQGRPATPVSVSRVTESDVSLSISLVGAVAAKRRSTVAAATAGLVTDVFVDAGRVVEAGAPLVQLQTDALNIEIEAARARKGEIEARYRQRQAALQRSRSLFEQRRISEEQFDDDVHGEEALRQSLAEADATIRLLEDRLAKKTVKAPFGGTIARKHAEVGQWVDLGGAVVDLLQLDPVDVVLDLPERYAGQVDREKPVSISAEGVLGQTFSGFIIALVPDADPLAHTLPLKVEVANLHGELLAGQFVKAAVSLKGKKNARLVPKDALVNRGSQNLVYVVTGETVTEVMVERGLDYGNRVEVEIKGDELAPGAQVVVRGNERLRPGQPVRVAETIE